MSEAIEIFRDLKEIGRLMRANQNLDAIDLFNNDPAWKRHTYWHWSRTVCGHRMDYWPSRGRWIWNGRRGKSTPYAVIEMILKAEGEIDIYKAEKANKVLDTQPPEDDRCKP